MRNRFSAPETHPKEPRQQRCCAKCRTPFNCGNQSCACHGALTLDRLIAKEGKR